MSLEINKIHLLDCLTAMQQLEDNSIDCIITSPPYNKKGLIRGTKKKDLPSLGKLVETASKEETQSSNPELHGKKKTERYKYHEKGNAIWKNFDIDYSDYGDNMKEEDYHAWMIAFLNECNRVIKSTGSIFFNHKPRRCKNQAHLPTDFIVNSEPIIYQVVIWDRRSSPNIRNDVLIPCTERVYWLRKNENKSKPSVYRNQVKKEFRGEVWKISVKKQKNHPAPFPPQLVENCILLSTQPGDIVLDPFMGCGTTAIVADELKRNWLGFEMDAEYIKSYYEEVGAREESNES